MSNTTPLLLILVFAVAAYWYGKHRALALVGGRRGIRQLHSLPAYYGWLAALTCALPCAVVVVVWAGFQDSVITSLVRTRVGPSSWGWTQAQLGLFMNDVLNVLAGSVPMEQATRRRAPWRGKLYAAARRSPAMRSQAWWWRWPRRVCSSSAAASIRTLRARNAVEKIGEKALLLCSVAGHLHHRRHRAVGAVRIHPVLPLGAWCTNSCSASEWSPQTAMRADQVGSSGQLRRGATVPGHRDDLGHRHADRRSN